MWVMQMHWICAVPCLVAGSEGRVACFLLPRTHQLLKSWSGAKGTRVCVFTFLREDAQRLDFFCYFIVTVPAATLMGSLFSRGIHCAICACLVSNAFSTTEWCVAQDRNTWMCESIVSLARNNTHAHGFSASDTSRSSERSKSLVGRHFICGVGKVK
ncbi:hypothetical protein TcCL_NonESM08393 [Trypanosoma cruzi]|nr:hypothetical protein TcCL_NonESM08393 [Trypanosoma cruzi]